MLWEGILERGYRVDMVLFGLSRESQHFKKRTEEKIKKMNLERCSGNIEYR